MNRKGFQVLDQYWCRHTSPYMRSAARSGPVPLSQADFGCFRACLCFQTRGPGPLRGGGRAPTHREIKTGRPCSRRSAARRRRWCDDTSPYLPISPQISPRETQALVRLDADDGRGARDDSRLPTTLKATLRAFFSTTRHQGGARGGSRVPESAAGRQPRSAEISQDQLRSAEISRDQPSSAPSSPPPRRCDETDDETSLPCIRTRRLELSVFFLSFRPPAKSACLEGPILEAHIGTLHPPRSLTS